MLGEAILWAVLMAIVIVYTITLWIPEATKARWRERVRRLTGR